MAAGWAAACGMGRDSAGETARRRCWQGNMGSMAAPARWGPGVAGHRQSLQHPPPSWMVLNILLVLKLAPTGAAVERRGGWAVGRPFPLAQASCCCPTAAPRAQVFLGWFWWQSWVGARLGAGGWEPSHTTGIPVPANPIRLLGSEDVEDPRPLPAPCSSDARAGIGCNHRQEEPSGRGELGLAVPGPACTNKLPGLVVPGLAGSRGAGASMGVPTRGNVPATLGYSVSAAAG